MDKNLIFLADPLILNRGTLEFVMNDSLKGRIFSPIIPCIWNQQWYRERKYSRTLLQNSLDRRKLGTLRNPTKPL